MWPHITTLMVKQGRGECELVNATMMARGDPIPSARPRIPIVAIEGRPILRATWRLTCWSLTGPGRVRIAFDADQSGRWEFHCHNLDQCQTGMMTE